MGFFDNLGKKASAAYDATAEKTGKLAKEAKFRMRINENKSDINDLYKEIGKKVYEKHVREENIDIKTELEEECTKIDVLSAEIETCLKSILELKAKKQCEKCHAEINLESAFCPKCGAKQPEVEVKEAEVVIDKLENSDVNPENETEKKIIEEDVKGNTVTENQIEKEKSNGEEVSQETDTESISNTESDKENTIERVTEILAQETQENAKEEENKQENQ